MSNFRNLRFKCAAKLTFALSAFGAYLLESNPLLAKANDLSWLTDSSDKTFDPITDKVKGAGASLYKLLLVIGIIGLLGTIIFTGVSFATNKSAQKKEENKSHLIAICIGGVLIFGAMFFVGLLQTIGSGLGAPTV